MGAGGIFLIIVLACFPALVLVALAVKLWEIRVASKWPATQGRITISRVQSNRNRPGDPGYDFGDTDVSNEPHIEYEYTVEGKKYRSTRFTIAEKTAGSERDEILARYPVGKVITVYYDPKNPSKAVIERTLPLGIMAAGGGLVMLLFVGVPSLAALLYFQAVPWLEANIPNRHAARFVAALSGFGIGVTVFAWVFFAAVRKALRWPTVEGRIVSSDVEEYRNTRTDSTHDPVMYKSGVVYLYEVNGLKYAGDRLTFGVKISASIPLLAYRTVSRYPVGKKVTIHYNPEDHGESVIHPRSAWHYLLWVIAAGVFGLAGAVAMGKV